MSDGNKKNLNTRSRITMRDIAAMLGVNVSTVSRAFNNNPGVGRMTRNKILALSKKLNYFPDLSARALAGKGSSLIGIIVPEIKSNYYTRLVGEIERELNARDYSFIIGCTNFNPDDELKCITAMSQRKVDGIIISTPSLRTIKKIGKIYKMYNRPILLLESEYELFDHVDIDSQFGINSAVEHLTSHGVRIFGYIGDRISAVGRLPLLEKSLAYNNLPFYKSLMKVGDERFEFGGYLRMKSLLSAKRKPEAVFATYDHMALGAMKAISEKGMRIPDDISIFGYDNITEAEYMHIPLTTISPPIQEMAQFGVSTIINRINNGSGTDIRNITLKTKLIIRESTI